jgi:hypothetical protein
MTADWNATGCCAARSRVCEGVLTIAIVITDVKRWPS